MRLLIFKLFKFKLGDMGKRFTDDYGARGVLNFELGTDVRPEVSTTTL